MNKTEIIASVAKETKETQATVTKCLDAFLSMVRDQVVSGGGNVTLVGFGTFQASVSQQRQCRNPRTGDVMVIPAQKRVRFTPGKKFRDDLKGQTS